MALDWNVLQSLISGATGLGGVWLGGYLTSRRDGLRERDRIQKETTYLAILVAAHLDRFVNDCVQVACDDGTNEGRPAGDGISFYAVTVPSPTFDPLALEVDWKVLPPELMYEILNIPRRAQQLEQHLSDPGFDDPPEYSEFFWERQYAFAALGIEVSNIAQQLLAHAGLSVASQGPGERKRHNLLHDQMKKMKEQRATYEAQLPCMNG
jgi:hypothetical protein